MRSNTFFLWLAAAGCLEASRHGDSSASDHDASVWASLQGRQLPARRSPARQRVRSRQSIEAGWNPPAELATPLEEVWDHTLETYEDGLDFANYGWDQLKATNGAINYCIRLEGSQTVDAAQRDQIATVVNEQYQAWFKYLYGFDSFPWSNVTIRVIGWAVSDASQIEGDVARGVTVYTDVDSEGAPQCAEACGRALHWRDGDYSGCEGGHAAVYDQSLWLTPGFEGGQGGDWGQRIASEYFFENIEAESIHILQHEMGHTFGLDDFYDWKPTGEESFVMLAGSSAKITDFDGWMLRNWWYELSRTRGWQQ